MSQDAPHAPADPSVDPGAAYQVEAQMEAQREAQTAEAGAFGDGPDYAAARTRDGKGGGPRRTLLGQAAYETSRQFGARLGLLWIAFVAVFACFAPFLANTAPFTWVVAGRREWPLFANLSPVDALLPILFVFTVAYVAVVRPKVRTAVAAVAWVLVVVTAAVSWRVLIDYFRSWYLQAAPLNFTKFGDVGLILAIAGASVVAVVGTIVPPLFLPRRQAAAIGVLLLVLVALFAWRPVRPPLIVRYDDYRAAITSGEAAGVVRAPVTYSPNDRPGNEGVTILQSPDRRHPMGTTLYGEDVLARMAFACRIALAIGFIATGLSTFIGVIIGGVMGYFGGKTDLLLMRVLEIVNAIPQLIVLLIVMVSIGRNIYLMMLTIGLISWVSDARFIRAEFLKLRKQDFVQAAQAAGLPLRSILFRHMLPNGVAPVLVNVSFGVGSAVLLESVLSFLGLGLLPEDPSWGQLLDQARKGGAGFNWWIATYPGLAIFLTVFAFILIGEAMRDAIDPKLAKSE